MILLVASDLAEPYDCSVSIFRNIWAVISCLSVRFLNQAQLPRGWQLIRANLAENFAYAADFLEFIEGHDPIGRIMGVEAVLLILFDVSLIIDIILG